MRIRSIKPEFWRSQDISIQDWHTRLVFIGLWSYVDDNGVGRDRLSAICADLFADDMETDPRDTLARVSEALRNLAKAFLITRYSVSGRPFLYITGWEAHQKIDHPNKVRFQRPTCDDAVIYGPDEALSRDTREILGPGTEEQGNRGTEEQRSTTTAVPRKNRGTRLPDDFTVTPEMTAWARSNTPGVNVAKATEQFRNYWAAKPGQGAVKLDWVLTWRNWLLKDDSRAVVNGAAHNGVRSFGRPGEGSYF